MLATWLGALLVLGTACTTSDTAQTATKGAGAEKAAVSPVAAPNANPAKPGSSSASTASPGPASGVSTAKPSPGSTVDVAASQVSWTEFERGGGNNVVVVRNTDDRRFRAEGSADLNRVKGEEVTSANAARAISSCTDCQSIAVAIQVVLYKRGASNVSPRNQAVAVNESCTRCVTVARAIQYVIPVDDPKDTPREVDELIKDVDKEFRFFEKIKSVEDVDPQEAEARLNALVAKYGQLQQYLSDLRDTRTADGGTPTPSGTGAPSVAGTPRGTPSPTLVSGPTPQPSTTPEARATGTSTPTASSSSVQPGSTGTTQSAATPPPATSAQ